MKIVTGIASTTHINRDGDRMSKSALLSMAREINDHFIPLDIEHKGFYTGVILCGKVKKMEDGEWGLYIVAGIFDSSSEKEKYRYREPNTVCKQYLDLIK